MGLTRLSFQTVPNNPRSTTSIVLVHGGLFFASFLTTFMAGIVWSGSLPWIPESFTLGEIQEFLNQFPIRSGLSYALLIMSFIGAHEFGHYVASRAHNVDASLPYFIPWPFVMLNPFGTMGALIRTRTPIRSKKALFDIGVAGPLSGFIVCLVILAIGYSTLPPESYLLRIHPELAETGYGIQSGLHFGEIPMFTIMQKLFVTPGTFIPPMNEVYHYPMLCVGWFGLFLTALNMMPFGQLDGGHVLFALIGKKQWIVGRVLWVFLFVICGLSLIGLLQEIVSEPTADTTMLAIQYALEIPLTKLVSVCPVLFTIGMGWLVWVVLIRFVIKIEHPDIGDDEPLSVGRKIIGWAAIVVLMLCFSPQFIYVR